MKDIFIVRGYLASVNLFLALLSLCCMPLQATPHRPEMVIVCDDDPMDLYLAELYMRDFDAVVTTVRSGTEGLRRVNGDWFDCAFVDLQLGDMTAIDFIEKAKPKNERIRWYVMSDTWVSRGGITMLRKVMSLGAQGIVKSSFHSDSDEPMKSFRETLALILNPKRL